MQKEPAGGAEDQEPETRRTGPAPPKKPLAEFLAEFEQRLLDHPEESATSALQVVEDRAGGQRRAATPGATARGGAPTDSVPGPSPTAPPAPDLSPPPTLAPPATGAPAEIPGPLAGAGAADAESSEAPGASAETAAESRRLRGRRRRRHRHRAH
jgi:hypothetical protein